jgi:hypothetical protein
MRINLTGSILTLFLVSFLIPLKSDADIQLGDSREKIIAELGVPKSSLKSGDFEMLRYHRGKIEINEGIATLVEMVSEETYQVLKGQARQKANERQVAAAVKRAQLIEEGTDLKAHLLADPNFNRAPFAKQVRIWRSFKSRYPDVNVTLEYTRALLQWEVQMEQEKRHQTELARVQKQATDAERRADLALRELQRERKQAEKNQRRTIVHQPQYNYPYYPYYPTYTVSPSKPKKNPKKKKSTQQTFQVPIEFGYKWP